LFTTLTCPVCKLVKRELGKKGVPFRLVVSDEAKELVKEYEIKQAPTLVVSKSEKYTGLSAIKRYLETDYANR
jgi:ribonucleoside-triphosphate reductase